MRLPRELSATWHEPAGDFTYVQGCIGSVTFNVIPLPFHTGWFVGSLATQTLLLFVIRTPRNPLASRPSMPLIVTTLAIVLVGAGLPLTPLAGVLGFGPLPATYFLFLAGATVTYLLLVELAKRHLLGGARKYRQRVPIAST